MRILSPPFVPYPNLICLTLVMASNPPSPSPPVTCVCSLMLYNDILCMGLEVAELAGEALDLDAMLAGHVDAELDLGGEDVPALRAENAGGEAALRTPVMLDVHVVPVQGELTRVKKYRGK